jgi:NitT/TauT family transport system substrate-binding protein
VHYYEIESILPFGSFFFLVTYLKERGMEKMIKRLTIITLIIILILSVGCNSKVQEEPSDNNLEQEGKEPAPSESVELEKETINIKIGGLKGPSSMGMIKLIDEKPVLGDNIESEYIIESAPDVLLGKVLNGEIHIAALPINAAAVLYNKTKGAYQAISVNTLSVLYLLEKDGKGIQSFQDLKGEKVYISGKGATPEYAMNYLLIKNGLDPEKDVELIYEMEHSTVASALLGGTAKYAVLPQPFVTTTLMKDKDAKIAIDFQSEWEEVEGENSTLAMTATIVKKEFAEQNREAVAEFIKKYKESVTWTNENPEAAGVLIEKHGILPQAKLAEMAIPKCNIVYIEGEKLEKLLNGFLKVIYDFNPKSIGGQLPDEGFYYKDK